MTAEPTTESEQLRRLQALTDAALSNLDFEDLLQEITRRARELLQTDTAAILLVGPTGRDLIATASSGLEREIQQGVRVPIGEGFTGRIAATASPLVLDRVDRATVSSPIVINERLVTIAGVPMLADGKVIGVLHVGSRTPRSFSEDDIELLRLAADRASLATQAQLSRLDRATTVALQRSLLPARPPATEGFEVAARYIPGTEVGVGGDWYDLFTLPSGRVGVVIGDVAGNGLRAAVVMGRVRSALRAYALETDDPADVLSRLDRKIQLFEPGAMATAAYLLIDPATSIASVSVAGHLLPLVVEEGGAPAVAQAPVDLPLGAYRDAPRRATPVALPAGAAMFLYTDGLVERRSQPIAEGIQKLVATLVTPDPVELCDLAVSTMLGDDPHADDVAVLAIRRMNL